MGVRFPPLLASLSVHMRDRREKEISVASLLGGRVRLKKMYQITK